MLFPMRHFANVCHLQRDSRPVATNSIIANVRMICIDTVHFAIHPTKPIDGGALLVYETRLTTRSISRLFLLPH